MCIRDRQKSNFVSQPQAIAKALQPNEAPQQSQNVGAVQMQQPPAPAGGQKLLSLKHIQIQNVRLANSQSDNYNSDNESNPPPA